MDRGLGGDPQRTVRGVTDNTFGTQGGSIFLCLCYPAEAHGIRSSPSSTTVSPLPSWPYSPFARGRRCDSELLSGFLGGLVLGWEPVKGRWRQAGPPFWATVVRLGPGYKVRWGRKHLAGSDHGFPGSLRVLKKAQAVSFLNREEIKNQNHLPASPRLQTTKKLRGCEFPPMLRSEHSDVTLQLWPSLGPYQ